MSTTTAYLVDRDDQGRISAGLKPVSAGALPDGDVLIRSRWTSLNYKDALAATGHAGVVRRFPHVPGIDVAGEILELTGPGLASELAIGDEVLVTGYDLGAGRWGGWSQLVRVPLEAVIKLPAGLSLREAMILGTAGFTAALCVDALVQHGIDPGRGDVVVTGATGGVGCLAVKLLGQLGYRVIAVTGKADWHAALREWGASEVVDRGAVSDTSGRPLLSARWAGAVDTVGGDTLATVIRQTHNRGCVAACGLVGGTDLALTVHPFILRGVTLAGIDSAWCPRPLRLKIWERLAGAWRLRDLDRLATPIALAEVGEYVPRILAGEVAGRTLIRVDGEGPV